MDSSKSSRQFCSPVYELAGEDGEGEGDEEEGAEQVYQALVEHQPLVPPRKGCAGLGGVGKGSTKGRFSKVSVCASQG